MELDQIVDYTKKFIEAVTPVAKQAYEMGLLTLRIDAAQSVVISMALLLFSALMTWRIVTSVKEAKRLTKLPENKDKRYGNDVNHYLFMDGAPHVIGGLLAVFAAIVGITKVLSVWMWVKLFSPELWLAHQAVEKLLK